MPNAVELLVAVDAARAEEPAGALMKVAQLLDPLTFPCSPNLEMGTIRRSCAL
jgi:hypothetical protein